MKLKRLLAMLLTVVMVFSLFPTFAFAEENDDVVDVADEVIVDDDAVVEEDALVEPDEAAEEAVEDVAYPECTFFGKYPEFTNSFFRSNSGTNTITGSAAASDAVISVTAIAPEGALPDGTRMKVSAPSPEAVKAAAKAAGVAESDIYAVDIAFSYDGKEIEPAKPVTVTLKTAAIADADETVVVHVDDNAQASVIADTVVDGQQVTFAADSFSVYAAGTVTLTVVEFYYEGTEPINTQRIKGSEKLYDPSSELTLENGVLFKCWHKDSITGDVVTIADLNEMNLSGTVKLYAETYKAYSVTYKAEGLTLKTDVVELASDASDASYTVNQEYEVASQNESFMGWMVEGTDTVYQNNQEINLTSNLVLVPKTSTGHWLSFNENGKGATFISPVFVAEDANAVRPADPIRPGYTFAGWYTAAEGGTEYQFGTLSVNTVIYAHWTMNAQADYKVNYWLQRVTDDVNAADAAKTYDFKETAPKTAASNTTVSGIGDKSYQGFDFGRADTNVVVNPDGSTVVNVYYDRKVCTVNYKLYSSGTLTCGKSESLFGHRHSDFCYTGRGWVVDSSVSGLYAANLKEGDWRTDKSWYPSYSGSNASGNGCVLLTSFNFDKAGYAGNKDNVIASDETVTTCNFYGKSLTSGNHIYYYNEQLDGSFKLVQELNTMGSGLTYHKKYEGYALYKCATGQNQSGDMTKDSWWATKTDCYDASVSDKPSGSASSSSNSNYTYIAHKLLEYPLNYIVNGQREHTEQLKYTSPLTGMDAKYTPVVEKGKVFAGWYKDKAFSVPFDFANETMPIDGVSVYAKILDEQYRVVLHTPEGSLPEGQKYDFRVNYGATIGGENLQEPLAGIEGYTLIGWYSDEAMTKPFIFTTNVTEKYKSAYSDADRATYGDVDKTENGHLDERTKYVTGMVHLYAKWRKNPTGNENFNVTYVAPEIPWTHNDETPHSVSGATINVGKAAPAPDGYVFDHWVLMKADGTEYTGKTYSVGDTITFNDSFKIEDYLQTAEGEDGQTRFFVELKAVYVEQTFTFLKYDANGGEFKEGVETEIKKLDLNAEVTLLTQDAFETKEGYVKFLGWNHDKAEANKGNVEFDARDTVGIDNLGDNSNTLYAVWEKSFTLVHVTVGSDAKSAEGVSEVITFKGEPTFNAIKAGSFTYGDNKTNLGLTAKKLYGGVFTDYTKPETFVTGYGFVPEAGGVYYMREVTPNYLVTNYISVYKEYAPNPVGAVYLTTAVDNNEYYTEVGFENLAGGTITAAGDVVGGNTVYSQIEIEHPNRDHQIYKINALFVVTDGQMYVSANVFTDTESHGFVNGGKTVVARPYMVTLDGVKVYGRMDKTVKADTSDDEFVMPGTGDTVTGVATKSTITASSSAKRDTCFIENKVETVAAKSGALKARTVMTLAAFEEPVAPAADVELISADISVKKSGSKAVNAVASVTLSSDAAVKVGFISSVKNSEKNIESALDFSSNGEYTYRATWTENNVGTFSSVSITPYWVLQDGTVCYGEKQTFSYLSLAFSAIIAAIK